MIVDMTSAVVSPYHTEEMLGIAIAYYAEKMLNSIWSSVK
jgi:hypothetical protein